jgi:serine/threonine protein kinase
MGNSNSLPQQGVNAYDFKFNNEHLIGKGGYSNVFRATRRHDNYNIAIKRSIEPLELLSVDNKQGLMGEITNMNAFPHPLIVKILDNFIDSLGYLCIVQELYSDGDFSKYLK